MSFSISSKELLLSHVFIMIAMYQVSAIPPPLLETVRYISIILDVCQGWSAHRRDRGTFIGDEARIVGRCWATYVTLMLSINETASLNT